jgi:hypothetical protein
MYLLNFKTNSMRQLISFIVFVFLFVALSCKKNDGPKTFTENPAKSAIESKLLIDTIQVYNSGTYEFGQKIYFSRNGKITQLGCFMPSTGIFRVSLWNFNTKDLITAGQVNVTDITKFQYINISEVNVTVGTRYVISINNTQGGLNKPYNNGKKKGVSVLLPFSSKSITYETTQYKLSPVSVFPDLEGTTEFLCGIPDVTFVYEE